MYHAHTTMVFYDDPDMYSPPVDCTLSLATPSPRLSGDNNNNNNNNNNNKRSSCISTFGWNILPKTTTNPQPSSHTPSASKPHRTAGDPLLARRCANCDTTSTPLWRNGPRGPKSLCNACGIRFKKEERRATAAAAANVSSGGGESQYMSAAAAWPGQHQKSYPSYGSEFRFAENDVVDFTWRFNVTDRSSFVHDFTR